MIVPEDVSPSPNESEGYSNIWSQRGCAHTHTHTHKHTCWGPIFRHKHQSPSSPPSGHNNMLVFQTWLILMFHFMTHVWSSDYIPDSNLSTSISTSASSAAALIWLTLLLSPISLFLIRVEAAETDQWHHRLHCRTSQSIVEIRTGPDLQGLPGLQPLLLAFSGKKKFLVSHTWQTFMAHSHCRSIYTYSRYKQSGDQGLRRPTNSLWPGRSLNLTLNSGVPNLFFGLFMTPFWQNHTFLATPEKCFFFKLIFHHVCYTILYIYYTIVFSFF